MFFIMIYFYICDYKYNYNNSEKTRVIYGIMKYIENIIFCIISIAYKSINLNGVVDYIFSNLFLDKSY